MDARDDSISRVHYFARQFLRPQDFSDEQAYHIAMRRRHNIAHHLWGIVRGLELAVEGDALFVQPGIAVDGYGRELILSARRPLPTGAFVDKGSDVLEVWLVYDRVGSNQAPPGYAGCGPSGEVPFYRWQEQPLIRLDIPDPAFLNRRAPKSVPVGDLNFDPSRTPPDDPTDDWPVFLGQLRRDPSNPAQPYSVDPADRPYVGLVGEAVLAPSGRARVQIGAELQTDPRRFAVFVPEADGGVDPLPPRLEIDGEGKVGIRGDATLQGNLIMAGGTIEWRAGTRAPQALPWRVYRVEGATAGAHELRIEMARPAAGGQLGLNQVVIGSWSAEDQQFHPCLTIADDCTVTVHGNLIVQGHIEQADRAPAALSPEANRFLLTSFLSGVGGASTLFDQLYRRPFSTAPGTATAATRVLASETGMQTIVENLAADPNRLATLANLLKTAHPAAAARLREVLQEGEA